MRTRVALAFALMCAIWGSTWLAIKVALTGMPPLVGVGARFVIAGLFMYLVAAIVRPAGRERTPFSLIVILAATLFGGNYALTYFAETHLASGLVAVLFGTLPFFIFVFGVVYVLAALAASASSAFANSYLKRFAHTEPLRTLPPAMLLAGSVTLACGLLFSPVDVRAAFGTAPVAATLYLALVGSGLAFFLNHWLLRRLTAWTVGLSALIIPVIAVAIGIAVAHEPFGPRDVIGAILVIAGIALALAPQKVAATVAIALVCLIGPAAAPATAADEPQCNNAGFIAVQHAHVNHAEVTFCGTVVRLRPARHTRAGWHRYIFVDVGHNNSVEIDANLDEMGNFPVTVGEHAVVRGEYYYDPNGREGVHWTHHTDRGGHPPGYLILNGTTYS